MKGEFINSHNGLEHVNYEAGKYRQIERECRECQNKFTVNIPQDWFRGDSIDKNNLPNGVTPETVEGLMSEPVCYECRNKEMVSKAAEQMAISREKYNGK